MNPQQLQELTTIETRINYLLSTLPIGEVRTNLVSAKKSLHFAICQSLEVGE
jgi:hypothetical protein